MYYKVQDISFIEKIEKELKNIDISDDRYYQNKKFKALEDEYVLDNGVMMPISWWIEKNIVGQERLEKIYGIYALGIEHKFSEKELKNRIWMSDLADKYPDSKINAEGMGRSLKDIEQYFNRKEARGEIGLIERLKKIGFDIDKFDSQQTKGERVKLLYFLFGFEYEYKVKLVPFLSNPSFENVDNVWVGDKNRNGKLMAYLKNNIMKEINSSYIVDLQESIVFIIDRWEEQIFYAKMAALGKSYMEIFDEIISDLQWVLNSLEEAPVIYMDSLLESFFLKLSLHEMIGRERELITISESEFKETLEVSDFQRERWREFRGKTIEIDWNAEDRYEVIEEYIKDNRKTFAQCVYGKNTICSNEYRKFDDAVKQVGNFLEFQKNNTKAFCAGEVPVIWLLSFIQEYIFGNEKIKAEFYRRESKDEVTIRTELYNGERALRRNQYIWLEKVRRRASLNLEKGDIDKKISEIERCLDKLLLAVYASNSLWEIKYTAWLILSYIQTFIGNRDKVEERYDLLIEFLKAESFCLTCCDRRLIYIFMNRIDNDQFLVFINEIREMIINPNEDYTYVYSYDIMPDFLYADGNLKSFLEIKICVKEKEVCVVNGGLK